MDYDQREQTLELQDRAEQVEVYMEVVPKYGISWGEFYLGVAALGLLLLLAEGVGVPLVRSVDAGLIGGLFLALILLSATYHVTTQRSSLLHRLRDRDRDR